ncbi:MAG: redox-regulated ATPase YchF [Alphaproteobacteria bacterium]|nr:redox-regulated ATPase YchF [Alphaproteobacteria bacterium]
MRVGICGYPGTGKSTVFSALAPGASGGGKGVTFGNIKVPDERIDQLAAIFNPKKKVYAEITFMDFAGSGRLDTGAFPAEVVQNMRNADVLVHVVRVFDNPVLADPIDPARDEARFNDELLLLDLSVLERRQERMRKENRKGREVEVNDACVNQLSEGEPLRALGLSEDDLATLTGIQLLSLKPLITLYNLSEDAWEDPAHAERRAFREREPHHVSLGLCGSLEADIAEMEPDEQGEFLESLGLSEPARHEFIRAAYSLLDYMSFLTAGPDECRAWPIRRGLSARKAAGKIHSDIERGFIRAEVYQIGDLLAHGSEAALKAQGLVRLEGKEYVMQDGDVVNFRFNV